MAQEHGDETKIFNVLQNLSNILYTRFCIEAFEIQQLRDGAPKPSYHSSPNGYLMYCKSCYIILFLASYILAPLI